MKTTVEEIVRDRILYIGNEIPSGVSEDKRDKFVLLGVPADMIKEIEKLIKSK
jgi:hypothetical protein